MPSNKKDGILGKKNMSYCLLFQFLNGGSSILHTFTRQKRFLAASVLKFMSPQV
jgi:hypothetical protein